MAESSGALAAGILISDAAPPSTVMVVGKSGMGKSTLCNYLLYGKPRPSGGFVARGGSEAVTFMCESRVVMPPRGMTGTARSKSSPLKMIDTPGIPDPGGRTLEFYNNIVHTMRRARGLHALIINVCYNVDRIQVVQDFNTYRILLTQFSKLPCLKILLCRVRLQPDLDPEQQEDDMRPVRKWVQDILDAGGMESAQVVYLMDNGRQVEQLSGLRQAIVEMPWTPISDYSIRTYDELKSSAERLVNLDTRSDELEKQKRVLGEEMKQLADLNDELASRAIKVKRNGTVWSSIIANGGILVDLLTFGISAGVVSSGAAVVAQATRVKAEATKTSHHDEIAWNERRAVAIFQQMEEIGKELTRKDPDLDALKRDTETLEQLLQVAAQSRSQGGSGDNVYARPPPQHMGPVMPRAFPDGGGGNVNARLPQQNMELTTLGGFQDGGRGSVYAQAPQQHMEVAIFEGVTMTAARPGSQSGGGDYAHARPRQRRMVPVNRTGQGPRTGVWDGGRNEYAGRHARPWRPMTTKPPK